MNAHPSDGLPRLAWLYEQQAEGEVELIHGRDVDVFPEGCFEGCHVGSWEAKNFDQVGEVFGSGVRLRDGVVRFVPPSHTLEALYVYVYGGGHAVSNSLLTLICRFDLSLPYDPHHGRKFCSIVHGIDAYERTLARLPSGTLSRVFSENFHLERNGRIVTTPKPEHIRFHDYRSYRDEVVRTLAEAFSNAAHAQRSQRYRPLATVSSGYDSACAAALARAAGCDEAVTLANASDGQDDSGVPVADALGMTTVVRERTRLAADCESVMVFYASGMGAEDYSHQVFWPDLPDRILITGFHGDKLWDLHAEPTAVIHRGDTSGCSFQEFRLRVGFLHIPVPMIAVRQHAHINAIAHSEEMSPYSVGGNYDRPIPRRVLEEQGVPRKAFGQTKKAVIMAFHWNQKSLPEHIKAEVRHTARESCGPLFRSLWYPLRCLVWKCRVAAFAIAGKKHFVQPLQSWIIPDWWDFYADHPMQGLLFLAAVRVLRQDSEARRTG